MDKLLPIILQLVGGAGGGNGIGALLKKLDLGPIFNTIEDKIGGFGGSQLLSLIPALQEQSPLSVLYFYVNTPPLIGEIKPNARNFAAIR